MPITHVTHATYVTQVHAFAMIAFAQGAASLFSSLIKNPKLTSFVIAREVTAKGFEPPRCGFHLPNPGPATLKLQRGQPDMESVGPLHDVT